MLPMHGGYGGNGYGRRRSTSAPLLTLVALLAASTLLLGWLYHSSRASLLQSQRSIEETRALLAQAQDKAQRERGYCTSLENDFRGAQRQIQELTRQLQMKEAEVQQREHALNQHAFERDNLVTKEHELQRHVDELNEQLNYERAIVEAHRQKISQLETAHQNREHDWHALSKKWKKYEEDATAENARLVAEISRLRNTTAPPSPHDPLPEEEPSNRPESQFDTHLNLPKQEDFVHPHPVLPPPQPPTPQQAGQQQQQQPQGGLGQQHAAQHGQHAQQIHAPAHGMQGSHTAAGDVHTSSPVLSPDAFHQPPSPHHAHHWDHYNDHHNWEHYDNHMDPLDHYWVQDGFRPEHDGFHGENFQAPPSWEHNHHNHGHWDEQGHWVEDHDQWHHDGGHNWNGQYGHDGQPHFQDSHHWEQNQHHDAAHDSHWNDPSHASHWDAHAPTQYQTGHQQQHHGDPHLLANGHQQQHGYQGHH